MDGTENTGVESTESNEPEVVGEPTGADLARDFAAQNAKEGDAGDTPAVEQPDGKTPEAGELPTVEDNQEIPQHVQEYVRQQQEEVKTHYNGVLQQYAQHIQRQEAELNQLRQARQQPAAPSNKFDIEAWKKLVDSDPIKAIQQAALMGVDPKLQSIEQKIAQYERYEEDRQNQSFLNRMDDCQKRTESKYPDFKPKTEIYQKTYEWAVQNAAWLREVAQRDPNFNPVEHAYKQVAFDVMMQKSRAQETKLVDKRKRSATVTPSTNAPVVPTGASSARAAAADLASKGDPVPESWVKSMERAEKIHGFS